MESSGGGVTFNERDLEDVKLLIGLLNKAKFTDLGAAQILQGARALEFGKNLMPIIEANIWEIKKVTESISREGQ